MSAFFLNEINSSEQLNIEIQNVSGVLQYDPLGAAHSKLKVPAVLSSTIRQSLNSAISLS